MSQFKPYWVTFLGIFLIKITRFRITAVWAVHNTVPELKHYSYSWFHNWIVENKFFTSTIFFGRKIFEFVFQITVLRIHFGDIWWFHDQFLNFKKCWIRSQATWKIIYRFKLKIAVRLRRILYLGSKNVQELNLRRLKAFLAFHLRITVTVTLTVFSFMLGKVFVTNDHPWIPDCPKMLYAMASPQVTPIILTANTRKQW